MPAFTNDSSSRVFSVGVESALAIISFSVKRKLCFIVPEPYSEA